MKIIIYVIKLFVYSMMLFSLTAKAQNSISGIISSPQKKTLGGVLLQLEKTKIGTTTNQDGTYTISGIKKGFYTLQISHLGYTTIKKKIEFKGAPLVLNFTLTEKISQLNEVVVNGKSKSQKLRETAFKPEVVSLKNIQVKATPVIEVIGQLSGVLIRQQGGLGSASTIMLNGASGKGIKTFVDGIPINLLGQGFQLNNVSSNLIQQIEIYKGVVPIAFGADAMGGIINIETQNRYQPYLETSYTTGSWNTHQVGIGIKRYLNKEKKQYIQVDGFFNHSDNDYNMYDVDIIIDELLNTKKGKAKRFNDKYTSYLGRFQYGFQHVSWADDFKVLLGVANINKQWQHGITALSPWGEAYSENNDFNSLVSWKKKSDNNRWIFSGIIGYNLIKKAFIDIAPKTHFWDGNYVTKNNKGESGFYINGRTPKINTNNVFGRFTTSVKLNETNALSFTNLISFSEVRGEDKAGFQTFKEDFYANPQTFSRNFIGISLESKLLQKKITNIISVKHHYMKNKIAGLKNDKSFAGYFENEYSVLGYGNAFKFSFTPNVSTYLGYEYSVRLPDGEELFGDGITIGTNPQLTPEKSHNINLGLELKSTQNKFNASINGFYRNTSDRIFLSAIARGFSSYFNLLSTSTKGIEGTIRVVPLTNLSVFSNITWQSVTLEDADELGKIESRQIGSKIPNTPYLFANIGVSYVVPDLFKKNSSLELSYTGNYVNEFFLTWENDGIATSKTTIPTQFTHNASIGYLLPNNNYSINLECRNFTNQLAFDNYKVQKPTRSFYLKLRMYIN